MLFFFQKIILINCKNKSVTDLTAGELRIEKTVFTCQVFDSYFFPFTFAPQSSVFLGSDFLGKE